jgi:hypothetical protein
MKKRTREYAFLNYTTTYEFIRFIDVFVLFYQASNGSMSTLCRTCCGEAGHRMRFYGRSGEAAAEAIIGEVFVPCKICSSPLCGGCNRVQIVKIFHESDATSLAGAGGLKLGELEVPRGGWSG